MARNSSQFSNIDVLYLQTGQLMLVLIGKKAHHEPVPRAVNPQSLPILRINMEGMKLYIKMHMTPSMMTSFVQKILFFLRNSSYLPA